MGVPERGVGDANRRRLPQPARETLGPQLDQSLLGPGRRRHLQIDIGQLVVRVDR